MKPSASSSPSPSACSSGAIPTTTNKRVIFQPSVEARSTAATPKPTNLFKEALRQRVEEPTTSSWQESVVYLSIGCYVREDRPLSIDQQLPPFLHPFLHDKVEESGGIIRAKAFLIDARFHRDERPPFLSSPPSPCSSSDSKEGCWLEEEVKEEEQRRRDMKQYYRGRLCVSVVRRYLEEGSDFLPPLRDYAKTILLGGGAVVIGIFTQPYYCNEDNYAALHLLYHALLHDPELRSSSSFDGVSLGLGGREGEGRGEEEEQEEHAALKRLQAFVLADYAGRPLIVEEEEEQGEQALREEQKAGKRCIKMLKEKEATGTVVWWLRGPKPHDQDVALLKDIARFALQQPDENGGKKEDVVMPSVGVPEYLYMQQKYGIGQMFQLTSSSFSSTDELLCIQKRAMEEVKRRGGRQRVLHEDEMEIKDLPFAFIPSKQYK
ncbi:hypothetical protein QOT17_005775 [Balamuthia mandrillaris]